MQLEHALLGRHAEAQWKAVVTGAAMNVQQVVVAKPKSMIGNDGERGNDGVR